MTSNTDSSLKNLYRDLTGKEVKEIISLTAQGSQRLYYRLLGEPSSCIGVIGNIQAENEAFYYLSETMNSNGVKIPKVFIKSEDTLKYLQEDLGDVSLYDLIKDNGYTTEIIDYCRQSLDELIKFQLIGCTTVDTSRCYPIPKMDSRSIKWDLNYFKYCFLKATGIEIDETKLENEFDVLTASILSTKPIVLIHRDFQSRNIMVKDHCTYLIDFQGARLGPAIYDVVSFLWQSRIAMPEELRDNLLNHYISRLNQQSRQSITVESLNLWPIVVFRMLQVLGAYGFRGLYQNKENFKTNIPTSLKTLLVAIGHCTIDLPCLKKVVQQAIEIFDKPVDNTPSNLVVHVTSFSYKKGYPQDISGNGGGFIFDCRAIHNPGRYPEYLNLTGNDPQVIEFLESKSDINHFITECKKLVDQSVEVYIKRGFTHLSVSFGCTGGQHRSVYSANAMAKHMARKFNIKVILTHREQDIEIIFNPHFIKNEQ